MVKRHVQIATATVQENRNDIVAIDLCNGPPDLSGPVRRDEIGGGAADVVCMLREINEHADGFAVHIADTDGVQLFVNRAGRADTVMRKALRTIGLPCKTIGAEIFTNGRRRNEQDRLQFVIRVGDGFSDFARQGTKPFRVAFEETLR